MTAHAKATPERLLLTAFCLFVSGCIHIPADPGYGGPRPLPEKLKADYAYSRYQGSFSEKILEESSRFTIREISFPSTHNIFPVQHDIHIDYYALKGDGKKPVILVLPILGGGNSVGASFARYFAHHGYAAVLVHRENHHDLIDEPEVVDNVLRQIVFDHKQALDWIESRPELDASRIGVFGTSMGAIKAALIDALDDRIGASVLALAGGDIPYLLTYSEEKGIAERRNRYLRERKMNLEEFHQELAPKITCDPIRYAEYMDAGKVLMILALFDKIAPIEKGRELREKIGNPETIYLVSGHYSSILFKNYVKYKARKFFDRMLTGR